MTVPPSPPSPSAPLVDHRSAAELVQRAGYPARLSRSTFGGPVSGRDVRCALHRRALAALLAACAASPSGRARCDGAALLVCAYRGTDGHHFERWTPLAARVAPEPVALVGDADLPDLDVDAPLRDLAGADPSATLPALPGLARCRGPALLAQSLWCPRPELRPRWLLDGAGLRRALVAAEGSLSGRAVLHGVGVEVTVHRPLATGARPYEVWALLAAGEPSAETAATG